MTILFLIISLGFTINLKAKEKHSELEINTIPVFKIKHQTEKMKIKMEMIPHTYQPKLRSKNS